MLDPEEVELELELEPELEDVALWSDWSSLLALLACAEP